MSRNDYNIDFVVPWVDGSDPEWIKEFNKFCPEDKRIIDVGTQRFRDFGLLKYWFRGVEKFAPWVRKVHFVTSGQKPDWLNLDAPKLNWVKHEDYIPKEYLPVFSSHPIELMMHKIPDLAEKFVYFNDDFFLIAPVKSKYFFRNEIPCDAAILGTISLTDVGHILLNNNTLINSKFNKNEVLKNNFTKWFNLKYGKDLIRTLLLLPYTGFTGFYNYHFANSYTKSLLEEVNEVFKDAIETTMSHRFRSQMDVSQYIFQDYRFCTGNFYPINQNYKKKFFVLSDENIDQAARIIREQRIYEIVLNDSDKVDFEHAKKVLQDAFEYILPEKSSFEL